MSNKLSYDKDVPVVPRIIDPNMKFTAQSIKDTYKKPKDDNDIQYQKEPRTPIVKSTPVKTKDVEDESDLGDDKPSFFTEYKYIIIGVIVLIIIMLIIYLVYRYYHNKNAVVPILDTQQANSQLDSASGNKHNNTNDINAYLSKYIDTNNHDDDDKEEQEEDHEDYENKENKENKEASYDTNKSDDVQIYKSNVYEVTPTSNSIETRLSDNSESHTFDIIYSKIHITKDMTMPNSQHTADDRVEILDEDQSLTYSSKDEDQFKTRSSSSDDLQYSSEDSNTSTKQSTIFDDIFDSNIQTATDYIQSQKKETTIEVQKQQNSNSLSPKNENQVDKNDIRPIEKLNEINQPQDEPIIKPAPKRKTRATSKITKLDVPNDLDGDSLSYFKKFNNT